MGCHRRKHKVGTTKQNPNATVAPPDLVERKFTATAPNQLWVADVERHEALLNRVEVGDLGRPRRRSGVVKLRAA